MRGYILNKVNSNKIILNKEKDNINCHTNQVIKGN